MMQKKLLGLVLALGLLPAAARAQATIGALTQIGFDVVTPNPTGIKMYYYVPSTGTAPMPIVLALHGCQGNQSLMMNWLKATADKYGFMLAIPFVNRYDESSKDHLTPTGCWDVASDDTFANATASDPAERSNSDPAGLYALVKYVGTTLTCGSGPCGDLSKVYATGQSSGAMMTNVMLGLYPDVFKAGAAAMGVPYKCWATGTGGSHPTAGTATTLGTFAKWSSACANGTVLHTPEEWAALLPSFSGTRPRMMLYHGEVDTLIKYPNLTEEMEQWTQALGVGQTPVATDVILGTKGSTAWSTLWTRKRYGSNVAQPPVETVTVSGVGHSVASEAVLAAELARFFGIGDEDAPSAPTGLAASALTAGGATLTWTAATDTVGVNDYIVSRVAGGTSTAVAWPTAATVALTGLNSETAYTYKVQAVDKAGNISAEATVDFTTPADTTPPSPPSSLTAGDVSQTGATLTWTASTDDVAVTGYIVSRQDGASWTQVATPTATTQAVTDLTAGTTYTFQVVAVDAKGNHSTPAQVAFTTTSNSTGGGGGGGCGQGVPSGAALLLAAAALFLVRRRTVRA